MRATNSEVRAADGRVPAALSLYQTIVRRSSGSTLALAAPALLLGLTLVLIAFLNSSQLYLWDMILIQGLFAVSSNVLLGWAGKITFTQGIFFGLGAYTAALTQPMGLSGPVVLLFGAAVACVAAAVLSFAFRLVDELIFAMLTLVVSQLLFEIASASNVVGGDTGISGIIPGSVLGLQFVTPVNFTIYTGIAVCLCLVILRYLNTSGFGEALRAIRDDSVRAAALGIPKTPLLQVAVIVSGVFSGFAGALFAQLETTVSSSVVYWTVAGNVLLMCFIGGRYRRWGPFVGAAIYVVLTQYLLVHSSASDLITGALFVVIVLVAPDGIGRLAAMAAEYLRSMVGGRGARMGTGGGSLTAAPAGSLVHRVLRRRGR